MFQYEKGGCWISTYKKTNKNIFTEHNFPIKPDLIDRNKPCYWNNIKIYCHLNNKNSDDDNSNNDNNENNNNNNGHNNNNHNGINNINDNNNIRLM